VAPAFRAGGGAAVTFSFEMAYDTGKTNIRPRRDRRMPTTSVLIKRLAACLEPLLETGRDREYWLTTVLADTPSLRAALDWGGNTGQFSRHLAATFLRHGGAGRAALCALLDDVVEQGRTEDPQTLQRLRAEVEGFRPPPVDYRGDAPSLARSPDTLTEILRCSPPDLEAYRLGRIAEWCRPRYALDKRFVRLALLLDKGEDAAGPRWEQSRRFGDLQQVLGKVDAPALVLLGAPGSGKSTLLRRLELDLAPVSVRTDDPEASPSLFVPLNQYRAERPGEPPSPPDAWLEALWARRFPHLLRRGRLVLLLDGLNEMPHRNGAEYRELVAQWSGFLGRLTRERPGNRVLFSCRSLDYSAPLSTTDLPVPLLRIGLVQVKRMEQCKATDLDFEIHVRLRLEKRSDRFVDALLPGGLFRFPCRLGEEQAERKGQVAFVHCPARYSNLDQDSAGSKLVEDLLRISICAQLSDQFTPTH
jgi:hypothetical protein